MSKPVKPSKDREKTRQTYESAMKDVEDGMAVPRAAKQWGMPESTLRDRLKGRYQQAGKGKNPILTVAEKNKLADWLVERSKRGFLMNFSTPYKSLFRKTNEKHHSKRAAPVVSGLEGSLREIRK